MKQYCPNVERQKELYSRMKAREIFRRMSGRTNPPGARRIPDNSEPWLPGGVHSVADAAARHADPQVRAAGLRFLRELAAEGDPFARDLLEGD